MYLPRFPDSSDASRVQLLATAVGYPSGAVFGCALHFRTHSFALPPDRHRSPFGSPPPDLSPGVFACSRLPFHFFLHSVPSLLQVRVRCLVSTCFLQGCRFALFEFGLCFLRSVRVRGDERHFRVRAVSDVWHYFFLHSVPSLLQVRCLVPTCFLQGCRFALFEFGRCFLRSVRVRGDKRHSRPVFLLAYSHAPGFRFLSSCTVSRLFCRCGCVVLLRPVFFKVVALLYSSSAAVS